MRTTIIICLTAVAFAFLGCGKKNETPQTEKEIQAAVAAPFSQGELKTKYDAVNSALAANNFAGAKAAYDDLVRQPSLTADQKSAAAELARQIISKAIPAAQKGDRAAEAVIGQLRP